MSHTVDQVGQLPNRQLLADHVYDVILVSLMDGRLEAGASVNIEGLARALDVSPTPVREALARLEATGMVQREARRGYRVSPLPTVDELDDLMVARLTLEPANAEIACGKADASLTALLRYSTDALASAPIGPSFTDFREYLEADERFHRLIAEGTGNKFLVASFDALGGQLQRFRLFRGGVTDNKQAVREHRAIVRAFEKRDAAAAAAAMRTHICAVRARVSDTEV